MVVGGGIIGLTTALELARAGVKVCVLDHGVPGREASWAGGGILSPLPPDHPAPEIKTLLDESLARYPAYCDELREATGVDPEYWICGAHVQGIGGERWFPGVAQVRNPRLIKALLLALRQHGVRLQAHTPAVGWQQLAGRLTGVITPHGVIACGQAVLAAGAWSGDLIQLPMRPVKGQMLLLRGNPNALDHIRMDDQIYLIPRREGVVLLGSTLEDAGFDMAPTMQARDSLMDRARHLWPGVSEFRVEHQWAGLRPRLASESPRICAAPRIHGLFLNTGHYRLGITLSLASAKRCAVLISGKGGRADLRL